MRILLAIFFALTTHYAYSQGPYVGFKLQGTFSTMKTTGGDAAAVLAFNENKKLYLGAEGGFVFLKRINKYFAFAPEVNFAMKGLKYADGEGSRTRRYMQVEVPMLIKVGYGKENFFIYATAGGYAMLAFSVKDIVKPADGGKEVTRLYFKYLPDKHYDAGIATGGGAMYLGRHGVIDLAFHYNIGMVKQYKTVEPGQPNTKWKSVGVSLAYMWKCK
jgi:hypothetical protein